MDVRASAVLQPGDVGNLLQSKWNVDIPHMCNRSSILNINCHARLANSQSVDEQFALALFTACNVGVELGLQFGNHVTASRSIF